MTTMVETIKARLARIENKRRLTDSKDGKKPSLRRASTSSLAPAASCSQRRSGGSSKTPSTYASAAPGRTIWLCTEQGYGDALQFIRYLPQVAQRGGRIMVAAQKEVIPLVRGMGGAERWLVPGDSLPEATLLKCGFLKNFAVTSGWQALQAWLPTKPAV